jgi:hypothetical protein
MKRFPIYRQTVNTAFDAERDPGTTQDSAWEKIIKYIPGEVVAFYLSIANLLANANLVDRALETAQWVFFAVFLVATPLYAWQLPKDPDQPKPSHRFHILWATIAFGVWAFAMGGPFKTTFGIGAVDPNTGKVAGWWQEFWGGIALLLATFFVPLFEKLFFYVYAAVVKVEVPNVRGEAKAVARKMIKKPGLLPLWEPSSAPEDWIVDVQDPQPGDKLPAIRGEVKITLRQP